MMRSLLMNLLALALTIAIATTLVAWWTVPIVAAIWTVVYPRRGAVLYASVAGALSWGAMLLWTSRGGPVGHVDRILADIMGAPDRGLIILTITFAALLAGSAALVTQAVRPTVYR